MPAGRPSSYKPEYAEQAERLGLLGATDEEFAEYFGVAEGTIQNWKRQHPEFLSSIKEGRKNADAKVASSLYQKALSGDTTACIFWLKNRQRAYWRDKQDHEHSGSITLEVSKDDVGCL